MEQIVLDMEQKFIMSEKDKLENKALALKMDLEGLKTHG